MVPFRGRSTTLFDGYQVSLIKFMLGYVGYLTNIGLLERIYRRLADLNPWHIRNGGLGTDRNVTNRESVVTDTA